MSLAGAVFAAYATMSIAEAVLVLIAVAAFALVLGHALYTLVARLPDDCARCGCHVTEHARTGCIRHVYCTAYVQREW